MRPETIARLSNFIGYGSSDPDVVYLGIEEADGGVDTIGIRVEHFDDIEDLRLAQEKLRTYGGLGGPFDTPNRDPVQQWNTAAIFTLALAGHADHSRRENWRTYWRHRLGRRDSESFLMECFPIPRHSIAKGIPGYDPMSLWRETRVHVLRRFLDRCDPQFLIAYGKQAHACCDDLFASRDWTTVPGTRWEVGSTSGRTVLARVGFFGRGQFSRHDILPIAAEMIKRSGSPLELRPIRSA